MMAKTGTQPSDKSDTNTVEERTVKDKAKLLGALEQSMGVVTTACSAVSISRDTHYRWLKEDKKYKAAYDELDNVALDFSESKMFEQIEAGDTSMIKFHLSHRGKKRGYSKRVEFEEVNEFKDKFKDKTPEEIAKDLTTMAKKMADAVK